MIKWRQKKEIQNTWNSYQHIKQTVTWAGQSANDENVAKAVLICMFVCITSVVKLKSRYQFQLVWNYAIPSSNILAQAPIMLSEWVKCLKPPKLCFTLWYSHLKKQKHIENKKLYKKQQTSKK